MLRTLKLAFNRRCPYHRRCLQRWCWRGQVYDHRCYRHQDRWHLPRDKL